MKDDILKQSEILPNKKICTHLNYCAINLKPLQILVHIIVYNPPKFQIDISKIEACGTHETKEFSRHFLISIDLKFLQILVTKVPVPGSRTFFKGKKLSGFLSYCLCEHLEIGKWFYCMCEP